MNTLTLTRPLKLSALTLPFLFIVMWSSGYPVGKMALPYAGPFTLLFLRFGAAAAILFIVAILTRAQWPDRAATYAHLAVVGLLIQVLQFFGVYSGMKLGVSAGVTALIIGTMPIFTALGACVFLTERVNEKQWAGLFAGLLGVALVVGNKLEGGTSGWLGYGAVVLGLGGITLGTLYQKKFCVNIDLRIAGLVQLSVASGVAFFFALAFEDMAVQWTGEFLFASGWLSIVNSIGAISLLYIMMRKGEASRVASLFYLIPGVSALMAYAVLGEALSAMAMAGFTITAVAVFLCTRPQ